MFDYSRLSATQAATLFGAGSFSVPVILQRVRAPTLLWMNRQAMALDPAWQHCGGDLAAYERHLVQACAYAVADADDANAAADQVVGHADRYGGKGIGNNGGSGRAALVNGYLLKGIGRTALVAETVDIGHGSGGAFLEEAIRESIYSEILRKEFPHGAVPILAIIDIGKTMTFTEHERVIIEKQVLVVRPALLRPAHFVRAAGFLHRDARENARDHARVRHMFGQLAGPGLRADFHAFFVAWIEQIAYSFAHRMPHGSNTISNICLDGALLDFGATSAVPSWARVDTMLSSQSFAALHDAIADNVMAMRYTLGRHLDETYRDASGVQELVVRLQNHFKKSTAIEILRVLGLDRPTAQRLFDGVDAPLVWKTIFDVIAYFQEEYLDHVLVCPDHRLPWDVGAIWSRNVPHHLRPLRRLLNEKTSPAERKLAALACRWKAASRPALYREDLKKRLFAALAGFGAQPTRRQVEGLIATLVAENRRDTRLDKAGCYAAGVAYGADATFAVFHSPDGSDVHLVREP